MAFYTLRWGADTSGNPHVNKGSSVMAKEDTNTEDMLELELPGTSVGPEDIEDKTDMTSPPPVVKPEDKSPKPDNQTAEWDKRRQESDQKHAVDRKRLEDKIDSLDAERQQDKILREELQTKLETSKEDTDSPVKELSEESEYGDVVKRVNSLEDQTKEIKRLNDALNKLSATQSEDAAIQDEREMAATLAGEYGAEHQNDALAITAQFLRNQGFTKENPATRLEKWLTMQSAFKELAVKGKAKASKPKDDFTLDTGQGGGAPQEGLTEGSLDDIVADMKAKAG